MENRLLEASKAQDQLQNQVSLLCMWSFWFQTATCCCIYFLSPHKQATLSPYKGLTWLGSLACLFLFFGGAIYHCPARLRFFPFGSVSFCFLRLHITSSHCGSEITASISKEAWEACPSQTSTATHLEEWTFHTIVLQRGPSNRLYLVDLCYLLQVDCTAQVCLLECIVVAELQPTACRNTHTHIHTNGHSNHIKKSIHKTRVWLQWSQS